MRNTGLHRHAAEREDGLTMFEFRLIAEDAETGARAGELHTPHGVVPTPAFMPCGTQATVKTLTPRQLATGLQAAERAYGFYHTFAGAEKSLLWAAKTGLRAAHRA